MTRTSLRPLILGVAAAATLCATAPAFAQENPAPSAAAVPPPMQAMSAPKGSEDMTGSLGFGVGVVAGTSLVTLTPAVTLKYWLTDVLAVSPGLNFDITKPSGAGTTTTWNFAPQALVLFVPFRSTSTRFSVGAGLGFAVGKPPGVAGAPAPNTTLDIFIPIQAGVEHFFTRWFSMGIAFQDHLIEYIKDNRFEFNINSAAFVGSMFFYTD